VIEVNNRNKLFEKAIKAKSQNLYWKTIFELRTFVDDEMIEKCFELINSKSQKSKIIAIDILSQLGTKRTKFAKKLIKKLFEFLQESENEKLTRSCLIAISHNNKFITKKQIKFLEKFKNDKSKEIRYALIFSILTLEDETAINILIKLSDDRSPKIRDWSLFGLGTQIEIDNKEIRKTLYKHCFDKDDQSKQEAIKGLANRNDERVYEIVLNELKSENFGSLLFETIMQIKNGEKFLPELRKILKNSKKDKNVNKVWISDLKNCISVLENYNVA